MNVLDTLWEQIHAEIAAHGDKDLVIIAGGEGVASLKSCEDSRWSMTAAQSGELSVLGLPLMFSRDVAPNTISVISRRRYEALRAMAERRAAQEQYE